MFDPDSGGLPPGEHVASWDEVVERFGWTERRRRLLDGLAEAIELLAEAGCRQIWLNGSCVAAKDEPGDFDACWDTRDKTRFGGELFPNVVETQSGLSFAEFFQSERVTSRKGIVVINLSKGDAS